MKYNVQAKNQFLFLAANHSYICLPRSPKPRSEEPKPYPRVDWFYQDDIRMDLEEQKRASQPEE